MTSRPGTPHFLLIPLMIALGSGLALMVLFLTVQPVVSVVIAVIIGGVAAAARRIGLDVPGTVRGWLGRVLAWDDLTYEPVSRRAVALEMLVIVVMVALATQRFYSSPGLQLSGGEAEWITNSAYAAHDGLRTYGRIPLWQPLLEYGEPLVDNPVAFILNPFSSVPSLILGAAEGLKISIVLTAWVAGVGGWMLGRVLGLGILGRVMLALLLVGKGNMSAMFNTGYFQLAASQAYFPWMIAGTLATIRMPDKRWPPVMFAMSFALLLFAGNVWYTLPMAICVAVVAVAYLIRKNGHNLPTSLLLKPFHSRHFRRLIFAGLLALGVSAANFIPLWVNQGRIGKHPSLVEAGWIIPLWRSAASFYFNPDPRQVIFRVIDPAIGDVNAYFMDRFEEFYFSFVVPPWFVLLILVALPFYRLRWTRIWLAAWVLIAFFTLWGAGGQPLFLWLYANIPFLQGWRFVGRALAIGSFWIAVLVAMRVDSLWRIFTDFNPQSLKILPVASGLFHWLRYAACVVLVVASLYAAWQVNRGWNEGVNNILNPINENDECVTWLRTQHPEAADLTIWQWGYIGVTTFMNNHVRVWDVQSDFEMLPMTATLGNIDVTVSLPEYAIGWRTSDRGFLFKQGYRPIMDSPRMPDTPAFPCLYRKDDTLSYAYTVSLTTLNEVKPPEPPGYGEPEPPLQTLPPETTTPITRYIRQPDAILVEVYGDSSQQTVLTLQERAYPGWGVTLDGEAAQLESVGGQIGIILPQDDHLHRVYFTYRPPLFVSGSIITLVVSAFCILYLLRVDGFFRKPHDDPRLD